MDKRITITVSEENWREWQKIKAYFLMEHNLDVNFTKFVNGTLDIARTTPWRDQIKNKFVKPK